MGEVDVISGVIEWRFDCDKASREARETFDKTMNRDWLLRHGINPFDIDAAWDEAARQLSEMGERCALNFTRIAEQPDLQRADQREIWAIIWEILAGGEK